MLVPFLLSLGLSLYTTRDTNYSVGDPRACYDEKGENPFMFEVLPGFGWDNLVNENRGVVVNFNFSKCKTTEDRRYLIPDGIVTIPIKSSRMNVFSKLYDHWSQYESDTAFSVNFGASANINGINIAASFSSEYEHIKKHQLDFKSFTTKVQARFVRYTTKVLPDMQLDHSFRNRLLRIAGHIQHNQKESTRYESELLVRDFGTHVLTSVDVGASIVKVDQVASSLLQDNTTNKVKIGLAANIAIGGVAGENITNQFSYAKSSLDKYMKNVLNSEIRTHGGPPINPEKLEMSKWTTTIGNDLVAIDKDGFPLDYVISTTTLPNFSASLVEEIVKSVRNAIIAYYRHNTHPGCTNPDAPNFSKIANFDDGTCNMPFTNSSFGGVYQECVFHGQLINNENLCDKLTTKNPQTQSFACPMGYEKVFLHKGQTHKAQHEHKCHKCWIFSQCCHDLSYYATATYTSFRCRAKSNEVVQANSGFLFGGLYSDKTNNFVTQTRSCPLYYNPMVIASNVRICISDDYELGAKSAVPFGGFYSCEQGNPLADGHFNKRCPEGFSNHLATTDNNCEIEYCVRNGLLSDLKFPTLQLPPFLEIPAESIAKPANYIISHDSESWMQLMDPKMKGRTPEESSWITVKSAPKEMAVLMRKFNQNHMVGSNEETEMSKPVIAGLSVGLTTAVCLILGIGISIRRYRKKQRRYNSV